MRRHGVSRPPFWAPEIFKANRQTQQIRHCQMRWKLACTPPQRRRRRNPGRTMTLVAKPPLSMEQCPATQRNLQLSWKSGEEEIKFRRLMRLRKNVWIGETNSRPLSVAATAALHYLQADDEPSNQTSTQQIKTGLPKAAGNVKQPQNGLPGSASIVQVAQQSIVPSTSTCLNSIWPSAINSKLQHPQFRSQKLPHIWSHFWLRAIPFIFNSFAKWKTFPASILNSQDGTSLAHPTSRIKKRGMIHGTNDSAESGQALSAKTIAKHDSGLNGKLLTATPWIVL